jgi:hypothetical protein
VDKYAASLEFIKSASAKWLEAPSCSCAFHPAVRAFSVCPSCGKTLCEACSLGGPGFCKACAKEKAKASLGRKALSFIFQPALWVLLCIGVSAGLYALGVGNPDVEDLSAQDNSREWHRREAPRVFLAQGARERRRAAALDAKGEAKQASVWHLRASQAYAKAAELWAGSPPAFAPALASASELALSGDARRAFELASKLVPPVEPQDALFHHFILARIASAAGEKEAARSEYLEALKLARQCSQSPLDGVFSHLRGSLAEAAFNADLRILCGLDFSPDEALARISRALGPEALEDSGEEFRERRPLLAPAKSESGFTIEALESKEGKR